jgi:hypothetical protein
MGVSVRNFYFIMHPLIYYYYCDAIIGKEVRWHIVESFQNGNLIQATMTQRIEYSSHYIPVRDKKILDRLRARLRHYAREAFGKARNKSRVNSVPPQAEVKPQREEPRPESSSPIGGVMLDDLTGPCAVDSCCDARRSDALYQGVGGLHR